MPDNIVTNTMLPVGAVLNGRYRIERYLSSGGFGNTYVATNEFGEQVAIKEFFIKGVNQRDSNNTTVSVSNSENRDQFTQQRDKFKKEAMRLRGLQSPHIVKVLSFFEENGTAYYVMNYIDGESLTQRLQRQGAMAENEVRDILNQMLEALDEVHNSQEPLFHLDIKPGNIMLDSRGGAYLIDFGASKQLDATTGGATASTQAAFTKGYAPLEQVEGRMDKIGPWTDFYALGATLYRLLTNQNPPQYSDIQDEGAAAFHFTATVSQPMCDLIQWMMQPQRTRRPQSVAEINNKLSVINIEQVEANETNADYTDVKKTSISETSKINEIVPVNEVASKVDSAGGNFVEDEDNIVTTEDEESLNDSQQVTGSSLRALLPPLLIGLAIVALLSCLFLWYANDDNRNDNVSDNTYETDTIGIVEEVNQLRPQTYTNNDEILDINQEKENEEPVNKSVEQMPTFPGGDAALMKYLSSHIQYPQNAADNNVQGKVIVQFVVTKTGKVGDVKVVRSVDKDLDREAVRVCRSLPNFVPGRHNGQPVNVWYTVPVNFKLI